MNSQHTKSQSYSLSVYTRLLIQTEQIKKGDIVYCDQEDSKRTIFSGYVGEATVVDVGTFENGTFYCKVKPLKKYFVDKICAYYHKSILDHSTDQNPTYFMLPLRGSNGNQRDIPKIQRW